MKRFFSNNNVSLRREAMSIFIHFYSFLFIHQKSMYQLRKAVFMNIADDYQVFAPISSEKSDAKLFI